MAARHFTRADNGQAIKYATVFTDGYEFGHMSLYDGLYEVHDVPVGSYTLSVQKNGYATISRPISDATWVQWAFPWDATAGDHAIEVRAIDGTGEVQTDRRTGAAPDGARGRHRISVRVD